MKILFKLRPVRQGAVVAQTGVLGEMTSITPSADGAWLYVPNYNSSLVEIIDPETLQITGQLPASAMEENYDAPWSITASQDGRRIVVAGQADLTVIDAVSQRVLGAVPYTVPITGAYSQFGTVSLSPHGDRAYIVSNSPPGQVQVIDTVELKTVSTLTLGPAEDPTQAGISPDSSTLYVGERYCTSGESCDCYFDSCLPRLLEISTTTLEITGQIALGTTNFSPGGIVVTRDGKTAYVEGLPSSGGLTAGGVSVVNLSARQVEATIPADGGAIIAFTANQRFLYEVSGDCGYSSINLTTRQVTCGMSPGAEYMAVSGNGAFVFTTNELASSVAVVATSPSAPGNYFGTINLPGYSNGVAFSPF